MPILNWKQYGGAVLGLRWPFKAEDVKEEIGLIASIKYDNRNRKPAPKELSGAEFIAFCHQYNK